MGTCKYCGKGAGLFSHVHKECEVIHEQGIKDLSKVVSDYFTNRTSVANVKTSINSLRTNNYLSDDDLCEVADIEIRHYTASIHRPFHTSSIQFLDDFLSAIGLEYSKINQKGALDEFTTKVIRGFMVEYFVGHLTLSAAEQNCENVLRKFPMLQSNVEDAYLYVLNKAAINFTKDGSLSNNEQKKIDDYINHLQLPIYNLPVKYQNSEIGRLTQMMVLKKLQNGILPANALPSPIILGRGEFIIWTYNGVTMYQEKTVKEYGGRRSGWSIRVMKGLTYHIGGTKVKPIEHSFMDNKGVGTLYITNKHIIFQGSTSAQKIPYSKMIGVTPFSDGIEIHRDGANVKRIAFQGFDSWFLMSVISKISNM